MGGANVILIALLIFTGKNYFLSLICGFWILASGYRTPDSRIPSVRTPVSQIQCFRVACLEDLRKSSSCGVWWCSNTIYMASTFPKVKEKLLLKELGVYDRIHFAQAKLHETNITVESPGK